MQALDAAFELSAELGTRHQRGEIEQVQLLASAALTGTLPSAMPLCDALGDGGLADTRLTDQAGIILLVRRLRIWMTRSISSSRPTTAIELAVACALGEIDAVGVEEFVLAPLFDPSCCCAGSASARPRCHFVRRSQQDFRRKSGSGTGMWRSCRPRPRYRLSGLSASVRPSRFSAPPKAPIISLEILSRSSSVMPMRASSRPPAAVRDFSRT